MGPEDVQFVTEFAQGRRMLVRALVAGVSAALATATAWTSLSCAA